MIGRLRQSLTDLVFPPGCALCQAAVDAAATGFCAACREGILAEQGEAACPTCADTVAPFEVSDNRCGDCRDKLTRVAGTVRVGPDGGRLGQLIRAYKFRGREELEPILGGLLGEAVEAAAWRDRIEAIAAVPTHWRHRFGRPLHAAEALASVVSRRGGLPLAPLLRRVRAGPHQIGLSYTQRLSNVRGAFAVRKGVILRNARLLLIDDVKTTGATIEECAKVLRRAGAAEVYAAVVIRAGWPGPGTPPADI